MGFKKSFWRVAPAALAVCALFAAPALANPKMAGQKQPPAAHLNDRFNKMDANGDGKVVLEEFRLAFPNMNEKAFAVMDLNGDNGIDRAEWFEFSEGHAKGDVPGMRRGAPMNNIPGDPIIPPPDSSDLPLMRPPN